MNLLDHACHIVREDLGRLGTQIDENEAFPYIGHDRFQAQCVLVDVVTIGLVGYLGEPAGSVVSPTVKSANEPAFTKSFLIVDQPIAAMHADVVEGPDFPVLAAHQQNGSIGNREIPDHVTAWLRKVFLPSHVEPSLPEDAVALEFKEFRRRVAQAESRRM